jgi:hypothetical protein
MKAATMFVVMLSTACGADDSGPHELYPFDDGNGGPTTAWGEEGCRAEQQPGRICDAFSERTMTTYLDQDYVTEVGGELGTCVSLDDGEAFAPDGLPIIVISAVCQ